MKVLHINSNYIYTQLHQTMIEHLNTNVDSTVFVPTYDKEKGVIIPNSNVVVSECFRKSDRVLFDYKQNKIVKSIEKEIDISEFDCIHAYTLFTDGNSAMKLARKFNKPYVVAIRNTDVNDFLKHRIWLRSRGVEVMKNADRVFFLSPRYKENVIKRYVPESIREMISSKSIVLPNGIDDFWIEHKTKKDYSISSEKIKKKRIACIFAGAHDKNKNIETILKAIQQLNDQGWEIVLYSAGKIADKTIFAKLLKYKCFDYIGVQKKEELIKFFQKSDIFVMVSHTETFGLVYAEAMSQGLPVIYTRGQGFDGQFPDGSVGFAVSDNDIDELTETIVKCLTGYETLSKNAFEGVNKFQWDSICETYYQVYKQIVHNKCK